MKMIINKPYLKGNAVMSKIEYNNKSYDLFFEINKDYKDYLTTDNANSFLIALLPFAVKHNYDIEVKSKISSQLHYQLSNYLLPLLCKEFKKKSIIIDCELTDKRYEGSGVGASISCGVDSFYTLINHQDCRDQNYNITHLCFFNAGSHGNYGGKEARFLYNERLSNIEKFCDEYKYKLITIDSNMNELIMMNHECRHTFTTLSCVYVLEKLFSKYYFASGFGFNGSRIDEFDTAYYDILNVQCLSNENITFYCSGIETTRIEKLKFISNHKITYDWLNVCVGEHWNNCGECSKCQRTLAELDAIKKLDLYSSVFDLEKFKKQRSKIYANILIGNKDKVNHEFFQEILDECKNNGVKIPFLARIIAILSFKKKIKITINNKLSKQAKNKIKKLLGRKVDNSSWVE